MTLFDDAQLRRLDINLLLVFEAAIASGKLSSAAKRLGLTQSAISHATNRLRDIFEDELFVRTAQGVLPTPRALALRAPLAEALRLLAAAVHPPQFDPARDDRVFRVAATDYVASLFAPALRQSDASAIRFVFSTLVRQAAIEALLSGDVDVVVGYAWDRGRACTAETLFEEDYLVVARTGHPALCGTLDVARYANAGHVLVAPGGTLDGIVDRSLAKLNAARRVVVAVPYFFAALATVARTDLLSTVPRRLALAHAASFGLATAPPPVPIRRFPVRMVWSRRSADDPASIWLRERIRAADGEFAQARAP